MANLPVNFESNDAEFKRTFGALSKSLIDAAKQAEKLQDEVGDVGKEVKKAERTYSKFSRTAGKALKQVDKTGQQMLSGLKTGLLAASAAAVGLGAAIFDIASTASEYQSTRNLFIGSDEKKTFERILDTATKTGIASRDIAREQASILQRTFKDAQATKKIFGLVQDIKFGADLDDTEATQLTDKIAELATKAEITSGDLEQLGKAAGVNLADAFADVDDVELPDILGKLREQFSEGEVGAAAAEAAAKDIDSQIGRIGSIFTDLKTDLFVGLFGDADDQAGSLKSAIDNLAVGVNNFKDGVFDAVDTVKDIVKWFQEHEDVTKILAGALAATLIPVLYAAATAMWATVAPVIAAAAPFLALGAAVAAVIIYWDDIVAALKTFGEWMWKAIKVVSSFFPPLQIFIALIELVVENWDTIVEAIKTGVGIIGEYLGKLWDKIKTVFEPVIDFFKDIGKDIIDGIVSGITNNLKLVDDSIQKIKDMAVGGLKSLLGISSPSKEFMKLGEFSMEGFNEGLKNDKLLKENKEIVQTVKNEMIVKNGAPTGISMNSSKGTSSSATSYFDNARKTTNVNNNQGSVNINVDARGTNYSPQQFSEAIKEQLEPLMYDVFIKQKNKAVGQRG